MIVFFVEFAIRLFKFLVILKGIVFKALVYFYNYLGRPVLRFIFYKLVVKVYRLYLFAVKRSGLANSPTWNFINQKLIHVLMAAIAAVILFSNIADSTASQSLIANASKPILYSLIQNEFGAPIDDQLIEEKIDDQTTASPVAKNYLEGQNALKSQPRASTQEQNDEAELTLISQGGTALLKPDIVSTDKIIRARDNIINYAVADGDTVSTIAQKFGITVNTILWENNLTAYSLIRPGDQLAILPVSGVTYKVARGDTLTSIANRYGVSADDILKTNKLASAGGIRASEKLVIPGGRKIESTQYRQPTQVAYTGISILKNLIKPLSSKPIFGNKMNWPTSGYRITQYYSWRHTAIDIANKVGTPIYAADAGTVVFRGWSNGYGNNIVIDHGGGKKTRYAHLSKFYCTNGQDVEKGESIGAMGSTGWSTGSHLHFEIMINGTKYNPLNYVK
ncbi:MAG: peptidoglycan DD-metalloendopeptidase family protein [Patescibacteria group bacterium]